MSDTRPSSQIRDLVRAALDAGATGGIKPEKIGDARALVNILEERDKEQARIYRTLFRLAVQWAEARRKFIDGEYDRGDDEELKQAEVKLVAWLVDHQ